MANEAMVRRADAADVSILLALGAEHAAFEQLPHRAIERAEALRHALEGKPPRLYAWIAEIGPDAVGYASASVDFSTLAGAPYLHMDCLYVRDGWRNRAIGRCLWKSVHAFALTNACESVQWQTPWWNADAARFYRRLGAQEAAKLRYNLRML